MYSVKVLELKKLINIYKVFYSKIKAITYKKQKITLIEQI